MKNHHKITINYDLIFYYIERKNFPVLYDCFNISSNHFIKIEQCSIILALTFNNNLIPSQYT